MVHVRETRAFASEIKFLVTPAAAPHLVAWARQHLGPDPHGTGAHGDEYHTTTLYFDTPGLDVFHRRGSYGRAKYRARRYGSADVAFLERKLRKPGVLIKRRTMVPLGEAGCLRDVEAGDASHAAWFNRRLRIRGLRPACQVSYDRVARQVSTADGIARLTLDTGLRAVPVGTPCFTAAAGLTVAGELLILELKYRVQLPALFRRLVEEFALRTATASKYRLGMTALGFDESREVRVAVSGADRPYA